MHEIQTCGEHYCPHPDHSVLFYGGWASSFAARRIFLPPPYMDAIKDGDMTPVHYTCREEYYQAAKAITREQHDWVLAPRTFASTWQVKQRGQRVKLRPDWEQVKYMKMLLCVVHEVAAYASVYTALANTGQRHIGEDSPTDKVWGIKDNGQNLLGLCWMQAREMTVADLSPADAVAWLDDQGFVRDTEVLNLLRTTIL